mmetsp:Transcript_6794/g.28120  ORF Transcript_6794/g.28120 Transcript_6794/m.28120 type:complete len:279 (-) Transcript_6794:277-1113(-)
MPVPLRRAGTRGAPRKPRPVHVRRPGVRHLRRGDRRGGPMLREQVDAERRQGVPVLRHHRAGHHRHRVQAQAVRHGRRNRRLPPRPRRRTRRRPRRRVLQREGFRRSAPARVVSIVRLSGRHPRPHRARSPGVHPMEPPRRRATATDRHVHPIQRAGDVATRGGTSAARGERGWRRSRRRRRERLREQVRGGRLRRLVRRRAASGDQAGAQHPRRGERRRGEGVGERARGGASDGGRQRAPRRRRLPAPVPAAGYPAAAAGYPAAAAAAAPARRPARR